MGYLVDTGKTLRYDELKTYMPKIRADAIIQLIYLIKKFKDLEVTEPLWGDEIEYHIIRMDSALKKAQICLNQIETIRRIKSDDFDAQEEVGSWMIEAVPKNPYSMNVDPQDILRSYQLRRKGIQELLPSEQFVFASPAFPMFGVGDFCFKTEGMTDLNSPSTRIDDVEASPQKVEFLSADEESKSSVSSDETAEEYNPITLSKYISDKTLGNHPRYSTIAENSRLRRGEKACILIPIFKDKLTTFKISTDEPEPGYIYLDAFQLGVGNCCIQQTFAAKTYDEARYLYDQLGIISPIVMALSASSPIFKGKLVDIDTRWAALIQGFDDRTPQERDSKAPEYIPKSRYESISFYISRDPVFKQEYNDYKFPVNQDAMKFAREKASELKVELDDTILNHIGFLMLRDPLVVYSDRIDLENDKCSAHFENIQSTNWNSVRFKPPPSFDTNIPWRVELRTCDVQPNDEENTAFDIFALLMVKLIREYRLNLYIPMSKLQENFERAQKRNAVLTEKFWFRKDFSYRSEDEYVELTIYEFLAGKKGEYKGLISLLDDMVDSAGSNPEEYGRMKGHMVYITEYIVKRASGERATPARWMREFVVNHSLYKQDSVVSEEIGHDLIEALLTTYQKRIILIPPL